MKRLHALFIAAACLASGIPSAVVTAADCDGQKTFKNLDVRMYPGRQGCNLKAGQTSDYGATKGNRDRSFTFSPNGQVMMFVGTKDTDRFSTCTGARCFHLLPFRKKVDPRFDEAGLGSVALLLPSAHAAVFSTETGEPTRIEGFRITLQPLAHIRQVEKNAGFFSIKPEKGFILFDYGWRTGEQPISQLWRNVTVSDGDGNACNVKMSEVFMVDPKDRDEVIFIHDNNDKLRAFLKRRCPKIVMP